MSEAMPAREQHRTTASAWGGGGSPFAVPWGEAAVGAARRGDHRTTVRFLALTVLGGLAFLGMQAYEWTGFIREGARLTGFVGELGGKIQPMFPAAFFVIPGFPGGPRQ